MTAIEEIKAALESCRDGGHVDGVHHPAYFNRAKVRAALSRLAELEKAEPVAITRIKIPTDTMEQEFQNHYRRGFAAGRAAAPQVPDGWQMVPIEPTWAMLEAAMSRFESARKTLAGLDADVLAYRAMLSAAPKEPTHSDGVGPSSETQPKGGA